jgi:hypothetical protein
MRHRQKNADQQCRNGFDYSRCWQGDLQPISLAPLPRNLAIDGYAKRNASRLGIAISQGNLE